MTSSWRMLRRSLRNWLRAPRRLTGESNVSSMARPTHHSPSRWSLRPNGLRIWPEPLMCKKGLPPFWPSDYRNSTAARRQSVDPTEASKVQGFLTFVIRTYILQFMSKPSNRDKILTEGLRVVHERGFAGASVRDIVEAAKVPQGSFTNHFASKEAFCLEILDLYFKDVRSM